MMVRGTAALILLAGCSTFEQDWEALRADITTLEGQPPASDTPIWSRQEPHNFDRHLEDGNAQIPDFIYFHVLRKLKEGTREEFRSAAGEDFDWTRCMNFPGAYRGKFWRVTGTLHRIWVEKIDDPASPLPQVYAGVFTVDEGLPIFFHLTEKPDVLRLREDVVELDGLFLKTFSYPAPSGRPHSAPFFLAKNLRKMM